jgi:hypothetical protein
MSYAAKLFFNLHEEIRIFQEKDNLKWSCPPNLHTQHIQVNNSHGRGQKTITSSRGQKG